MGFYDHTEFIVWQRANDVRQLVRGLTTRPAFSGHWWLRTQLRRAANTSCTSIAEGFGKFYPLEFARYLQISKGSLKEIIDHLPDVVGLGLASPDEATEIRRLAKRGCKAAVGLILYLESLPPDRIIELRQLGQYVRGLGNPERPRGTPGTPRNREEPPGTPRNPSSK
ncbi:MAG TPA: four helix bundle protein [Vicinamibacterales bacterium]|nr:four helix bundle protein [Vicinamibacterales bacterium]